MLVKYRVAKIEVTETVQDYSMSIPDSYKGLCSYLKAFLSVSTGLFYGAIIIARKVFVSYKYADSSVASISNGYSWYNKSTVRDYVDLIENRMGNTNCAYYKGERNNQDLSYLTEDMIWEKLKDKIYDSSVTIVLISPNMRETYRYDEDQWIPWEISYSLRNQSRNGRTSYSNALLFVILPNSYGSYDYYQPSSLFKIMRDNISNNYAEVIQWNTFNSDMEYYIERAVTKKNSVSDYNIVKTI